MIRDCCNDKTSVNSPEWTEEKRMRMKCKNCKNVVVVKFGKDLLCGKCGHLTKDAIINDEQKD